MYKLSISLKGLGDRCRSFCGYSFAHHYPSDYIGVYGLITDTRVRRKMFESVWKREEMFS